MTEHVRDELPNILKLCNMPQLAMTAQKKQGKEMYGERSRQQEPAVTAYHVIGLHNYYLSHEGQRLLVAIGSHHAAALPGGSYCQMSAPSEFGSLAGSTVCSKKPS